MPHILAYRLCLLLMATVVTLYGVLFVAIGTHNYERIQSGARNVQDSSVRAVTFKPPPPSAPRHLRDEWSEQSRVRQPVELDRRAGEFFTAPDVERPYLAVACAGAWISGAFFFVLSGCLRIWFHFPGFRYRKSAAYLLGATTLSVSVVCFSSRLVFTSWIPCHLLNGSSVISDPNWVSWAYVQAMINSTRPAVAWAVVIGILSWFSLFSMTAALRHVSIREPQLHTVAQVFGRVTVWFALPLVVFYLAIAFVVGQLPQPSWLIPMTPL